MNQKRPRWKLLIIQLGVLTIAWFVIRRIPQVVDMGADGAVDLLFAILVLIVGLLWLLCFSRLRWAIRWLGVACLVLLASVVRMDGHTGGFFPQFSFVWSQQAASEVPELAEKVTGAGESVETAGSGNFPRFLGAEMNNRVSGE